MEENRKKLPICLNCKHLMFSDCYGECRKAYKGIVNPDDTCEHFENNIEAMNIMKIEHNPVAEMNEIISGSYCPDCEHFTWCEWGKIVATALSNKPCTDYEDSTHTKLYKLIYKLGDKQIEYLYTFAKGVFGE